MQTENLSDKVQSSLERQKLWPLPEAAVEKLTNAVVDDLAKAEQRAIEKFVNAAAIGKLIAAEAKPRAKAKAEKPKAAANS